MSSQAAAAGVRPGMRRAGVQAICPKAMLHDNDPLRVQEALAGVALTLLQYTPEVALAEEASLLLDVTASLRAFGGRLVLCRLVRASIDVLGFTPHIAMAPTAQGAWLLARHSGPGSLRRRVVRIESLTHRLDALPCMLLPPARPYQDWLQGIGCHRLGELRGLPRAGLQRRADRSVLDALDRAYGKAPELFEWVQAPKTFSARLELPQSIEHAEAVLFAARRLIVQLVGWLVVQHLAVSHFVLLLEHERGRAAIAPTPVDIMLAEPAWHEEHLTRLLKERLGCLALSAPLIAVHLKAVRVNTMLPPSEVLFPEPGGTPADYHRLLELLIARLGEEGVLAPSPRADHRPEICNAWLPYSVAQSMVLPGMPAERPFWLLERPIALILHEERPFYESPLRMVKGPERIECGWWDGGLIVRDYFIMQSDTAAFYWVYRERSGEDIYWFLHGLFA